MSKTAKKILVIVGQTASGKSDLAIKVARKFNGEIISADSRQVYRGMDLGTGKVPKDKIKKHKTARQYYSGGICHYLIDVASPKKQFTADDFKKSGQKAIEEIMAKNKIPVIVGGAGFYIDVLLGRISVAEVPPDKKLRLKIEKQSTKQLLKKLQKLDPERARTIDSKNKRRLIRALEIVLTTGKPVAKPILSVKYKILWLGLKPKDLEKRIELRLNKRLRQGMIKEVEGLREQGVSWKRLDDLGLEYRWTSRWLKNNPQPAIDNSQFKKSEEYLNLLRDIIKYSKRQTTWFKRNKEIHWLAPSKVEGVKEAEKLTQSFL
ncbi:MAG: tRNA (adenosine(37)-N6)-dimethylallyltransferase MiaA [Patescibacteria group bacterium]